MTTQNTETTNGTVHEGEVVHEENGKKSRKRAPGTAIAHRQIDAAALPMQQAPPVPRVTIEDMIMKALDMDKPELIDKFMAIYETQQADQRKTAYTAAMARAQAKMVPVANNAVNTHTSSRYAKLAAINRMAVPIYGAEGLAVSFKTGVAEDPGDKRTIAIVSHEAGYMSDDDDFYVDLPLDDKGSGGVTNKTRLHATKSTNTYAKNMLVCMIFNISTEDEDDDGNAGAGISPRNAREQKNRSVSQPRERKGSQSEAVPPAERPQIEPVSESGNGINKATAKGFSNAITTAFKGYGDKALEVGWAEFKKRFPKIDGMAQIPDTPEAKKIVLDWIANPQVN